ncbi:hypothetical protein FQN54_002587 [Arachnomyces sp. PD_36]|nr:hypothetical protein FQN54_002587 [Arachnomyces sp. PD_36]
MSSTNQSDRPIGEQTSDIVSPKQYGLPVSSACQKLSTLDMNMPRLYAVRWILCFSLSPSSDKAQIYETLRIGLARTLSSFPWLAGDIGPEEGHATQGNRIQIVDSIGGVNFLKKDLSSTLPTYEELQKQRFPLSVLSKAPLSPLGVMPEPPRQPVMAAQANFIEGGLLLALASHHSLCDASAFHVIIRAWADNTAAATISKSVGAGEPIWNDRSILTGGISGANPADFPEYILSPTPQAATGSIPFELPPMVSRIFYFSPDSLAELKVAAGAYSTNDALSAFLWRHITIARNPPEDCPADAKAEEKTSSMLYAVNIRDRSNPPIPSDYTGNASMAGITNRLKISTLTSKSGLNAASTSIRESLQVFKTPNRVQLTIGLIDSRPDPTDYKLAYNGFLGPDISFTTWSDLQVYEDFWGELLGKPEFFRMPGEGADGSVIVFPRLPATVGGGLEVMVGLELGAMERLLGNEDFQRTVKLGG